MSKFKVGLLALSLLSVFPTLAHGWLGKREEANTKPEPVSASVLRTRYLEEAELAKDRRKHELAQGKALRTAQLDSLQGQRSKLQGEFDGLADQFNGKLDKLETQIDYVDGQIKNVAAERHSLDGIAIDYGIMPKDRTTEFAVYGLLATAAAGAAVAYWKRDWLLEKGKKLSSDVKGWYKGLHTSASIADCFSKEVSKAVTVAVDTVFTGNYDGKDGVKASKENFKNAAGQIIEEAKKTLRVVADENKVQASDDILKVDDSALNPVFEQIVAKYTKEDDTAEKNIDKNILQEIAQAIIENGLNLPQEGWKQSGGRMLIKAAIAPASWLGIQFARKNPKAALLGTALTVGLRTSGVLSPFNRYFDKACSLFLK